MAYYEDGTSTVEFDEYYFNNLICLTCPLFLQFPKLIENGHIFNVEYIFDRNFSFYDIINDAIAKRMEDINVIEFQNKMYLKAIGVINKRANYSNSILCLDNKNLENAIYENLTIPFKHDLQSYNNIIPTILKDYQSLIALSFDTEKQQIVFNNKAVHNDKELYTELVSYLSQNIEQKIQLDIENIQQKTEMNKLMITEYHEFNQHRKNIYNFLGEKHHDTYQYMLEINNIYNELENSNCPNVIYNPFFKQINDFYKAKNINDIELYQIVANGLNHAYLNCFQSDVIIDTLIDTLIDNQSKLTNKHELKENILELVQNQNLENIQLFSIKPDTKEILCLGKPIKFDSFNPAQVLLDWVGEEEINKLFQSLQNNHLKL